MPPILLNIAAWLGARALKIGLALLLAAALLGGGFVWGDTHASSEALAAAARQNDARVVALQKSYQASIQDYLNKLSVQSARGDSLAAALSKTNSQLAAQTAQAREAISHAVPSNSACDLPAAALDVLRRQPARQ